jgi:hypothetical protein
MWNNVKFLCNLIHAAYPVFSFLNSLLLTFVTTKSQAYVPSGNTLKSVMAGYIDRHL